MERPSGCFFSFHVQNKVLRANTIVIVDHVASTRVIIDLRGGKDNAENPRHLAVIYSITISY